MGYGGAHAVVSARWRRMRKANGDGPLECERAMLGTGAARIAAVATTYREASVQLWTRLEYSDCIW